jgi:site-specific DNA recombinase
MEKTFLYLRVSTPGQAEGFGFDRQEEACRAYAKKAGYEVAGVFQEAGVSGVADETQRPAFQEMMTDILSNGVKTVIVESMDRLARELRIQETLLIYLASKGVT